MKISWQCCSSSFTSYLLATDTLHRLLHFLSTVARHAEDTTDKEGQEITGNKMTSLNLATIFGPNLLHKQKSSDKEFTVQSTARAEESTTIISVVQKMIENYENLFMVPPDLQNEVLLSLLETDPDVVDYLLRRKASQSSSPELLRSEGSFSMEGRHSSTDSNKASSGDVSPYDNNSPVLSDRSATARQENEKLLKAADHQTLVSHLLSKTQENASAQWCTKDATPQENLDIWGTWHSTLKSASKDQGMTGSFGNIHESSSLHKGQCSLSQSNLTQNWPSCKNSTPELDNGKPNIRRTHTSVALQDCRPHSSVTRASSTPQTEMARRNLDHKSRCEQHLVSGSTEHVTEDNAQITCTQKRPPPLNLRHSDVNRNEARLPPPYPGSLKQGASQPHRSPVFSAEQALWRLPRSETVVGTSLARTQPPEQSVQNRQMSLKSPANNQNSKTLTDPDWQEWQRERWQIWELLSTDNPDTLPETLV